jgi:hypothetical protein
MRTHKTDSPDPLEHTVRLKEQMKELITHLREDVSKVDEPQAKAMFELSAEVIEGLHKAFTEYESRNEAWRME